MEERVDAILADRQPEVGQVGAELAKYMEDELLGEPAAHSSEVVEDRAGEVSGGWLA